MNSLKKEFLKFLESLNEEDFNVKINNISLRDKIIYLVGLEEEYAGVLIDFWKTNEKPWFLCAKNYDSFNKTSIQKYKSYSSQKLIERLQFLIDIFENEVLDIGVEKLKERKGSEWIFDDSRYSKCLVEIKKVLAK